MFFDASKIFWFLCRPSSVMGWFILLAALLLLIRKGGAGRLFAIVGGVLFFLLGIMPSYQWLGRSLESQFDGQVLPAHTNGILILGGGGENIRRLPVALLLSRRYPNARIVFSGGSGELINNRPNIEAQEAKDYLVGLGLDPARLTLEGHSRNTYENFVFTKALIKPRPGESWILVTSAYHMPRAMQIANHVHWTMIPWSSNRLTERRSFEGWFGVPSNLANFDLLLRERIGMLVYRLSGKAS